MEELLTFAGANKPVTVPVTHVVASGETLHSIAEKYQVSEIELINANPQLLSTGMKLSVPGQIATPTTPRKTYIVRPGDTLYAIASKHRTTVAALAARNRIPNPDLIQVGQVLYLA